MNTIKKYIPSNTLRRPGLKLLGVKFIVAHDTGNDNSTAMQNVDYYIRSCNESEASAHAFVDDQSIIECIPLDEKAYHVRRVTTVDNSMFGLDSIDDALGIELCFFSKDVVRSKKAYDNYVEYIKYLISTFNLTTKFVVGHYTLDPSRRTDPLNAFKIIGKNWDDFIKDLSLSQKASKQNIIDSIDDLRKKVVDL